MYLVLGLIFFLCLMFLTMVLGERLSLFGLTDWRWLTAPFDLAARFWDGVCEAADRIWCFVFEHFWWVAATVSGGIGIVLIALILVSGLSSEARAVRRDANAVLDAGSVLDDIPTLDAGTVLQPQGTPEKEISQLMFQHPSSNGFAVPDSIRRPVVTDFESPLEGFSGRRFVPPLELPSYRRQPDTSRGRLRISMEPFLERQGRRLRSSRIDRLIEQTVRSLRNDDWRTSSDFGSASRMATVSSPLAEDSSLAVKDLHDRVRVIPGDQVSSQSLEVRKSTPSGPSADEFEIQIRVTNVADERISGLIVRELLPASWSPVEVQPRGVYRDSVVTWLVSDLEPFEEKALVLRVQSSESGRFQSFTEVSATAAVSSFANVAKPSLRTPGERPLPPVKRLPDVRVTLQKPPARVMSGQWVDVNFVVRNIGDAPADDVMLRVNLPLYLDHHDLDDTDINRQIDSRVSRLDPGESRRITLRVQPTVSGRHSATAELLLRSSQLDIHSFEIVAEADPQDERREELLPRPDFE